MKEAYLCCTLLKVMLYCSPAALSILASRCHCKKIICSDIPPAAVSFSNQQVWLKSQYVAVCSLSLGCVTLVALLTCQYLYLLWILSSFPTVGPFERYFTSTTSLWALHYNRCNSCLSHPYWLLTLQQHHSWSTGLALMLIPVSSTCRNIESAIYLGLIQIRVSQRTALICLSL